MQICVLYKWKTTADSFACVSVLLFLSGLIQIFIEEKRTNRPAQETLPLSMSPRFWMPFWCSTVPPLCKASLVQVYHGMA